MQWSDIEESVRRELLGFMPKCLERRGDRYYPTEAGCVRLREWLAEKGIDCNVVITDDEQFQLVDSEEPRS